MANDFKLPSPKHRNNPVPTCPVQNVIRANEFGMVIESNRSFEVGEAMSFGFHLPGSRRQEKFITAEALVVDSQKLRLVQDRDAFRVTVLFSEISHEDRNRIIEVTRSNNSASSSVGLN